LQTQSRCVPHASTAICRLIGQVTRGKRQAHDQPRPGGSGLDLQTTAEQLQTFADVVETVPVVPGQLEAAAVVLDNQQKTLGIRGQPDNAAGGMGMFDYRVNLNWYNWFRRRG